MRPDRAKGRQRLAPAPFLFQTVPLQLLCKSRKTAMRTIPATLAHCFLATLATLPCRAESGNDEKTLDGTKPLTMEGDIAAEMVAGIDRFLLRELAATPDRRA